MDLTNARYHLKAMLSFRRRSLFKLNHTLKPVYYTGLQGPKMQW
jgi:hypothetical protein